MSGTANAAVWRSRRTPGPAVAPPAASLEPLGPASMSGMGAGTPLMTNSGAIIVSSLSGEVGRRTRHPLTVASGSLGQTASPPGLGRLSEVPCGHSPSSSGGAVHLRVQASTTRSGQARVSLEARICRCPTIWQWLVGRWPLARRRRPVPRRRRPVSGGPSPVPRRRSACAGGRTMAGCPLRSGATYT